jgi:hypothetical protein
MNNDKGIKNFLKENLIWLLGVSMAILNLWLANTLSPIASTVSLINQRVEAIERAEPITSKQFDEFCRRLDRIEGKLDNYIFNTR